MEYPRVQITAMGAESHANLTVTCSSESVTDTEIAQAFADAMLAMPQFTSVTARLQSIESVEVVNATD